MSYLSTLGSNPNPIIEQYQQAFLQKIHLLWRKHISSNIPSDEFLLYPDIHGLLLASDRPGSTQKQLYQDILRREHALIGTSESILFKQSHKIIPHTQIELTLDFYNPDIDNHTHPDHKKNQVGITF